MSKTSFGRCFKFVNQLKFANLVMLFGAALMLFAATPLHADCRSLLEKIEATRLKKIVDFALDSPGKPIVVDGFPIHFTSNMALPYVWLTNPAPDSKYFVVKKNDRGFGFGQVAVSEFHILNEPNITLRSLDFSGTGDYLLASLVHRDPETGESGVVFKLATISDSATGELEIVASHGLAFEDFKDTGKNFVVTSRPSTNEFWIADGAARLRVIHVDEEAESVENAIEIALPAELVKRATKVQFFPNGRAGYIRAELQTGEWALIPFTLKIAEVKKEAENKSEEGQPAAEAQSVQSISINLLTDSTYKIGADYVRTAAHPTDPIILIAYKDRIEGVGLNLESGSLMKVYDQEIKFLQPGEEVLGIDFYWDGDVVEAEEGKEPVFHGKVQGALLIGENERAKTRLYWLNLKNGSGK